MIIAELFSRLGLQVDEGSWSRGDKLISGMKGALLGLAAGFGIHAISEMVHGVADLADHASKASQILGITTESVQELGYAAKLADVGQEQLEKGLNHLALGMAEVSKGTGPAADAFAALHISAAKIKGLKLDDVLGVVADAIAKLPDGQQKLDIAAGIFGKGGRELIPMLNDGSKGINALKKEADDLGIVVSGPTGKAFEKFNDDQTRLSETWRGLKTQIVTALLPGLQDLVTGALEWVKANKELIHNSISAVVSGAIVVVKGLAAAFEFVVEAIGFFSTHTEAMVALLTIVGAVFAEWAISMAASWVLALGPADLLLAVVALVAAGVTYMVKHWEKFAPAVQKVRTVVASFGQWILDIPRKIGEAFLKGWEAVKSGAKAAFEWIINLPVVKQLIAIGGVIANPRGAAQGVIDGIKAIGGSRPGQAAAAAGAAGPAMNVQSILAPSSGAAQYVAQLGDTHISVTAAPGQDASALAQMIGDIVDDKQSRMIKDAHEALRGGLR